MIEIVLDLPRDTPRSIWRQANRWRRLSEHCINAELLDRANNLAAFGTTHPELSSEFRL